MPTEVLLGKPFFFLLMNYQKKQEMKPYGRQPDHASILTTQRSYSAYSHMITNCLRAHELIQKSNGLVFQRTQMELIVSHIDKIQNSSNDVHKATNEHLVRCPFWYAQGNAGSQSRGSGGVVGNLFLCARRSDRLNPAMKIPVFRDSCLQGSRTALKPNSQ